MAGKIYVVATPIGNLEDISTRAIRTLREVNAIFAEDTRVTQKLLGHYGIKTLVDSYHAHSSHEKKLFILNKLMSGESIALVTDAGTPGISDPGNELLDFLYENAQIDVVAVPGPSSVTSVLSISGFNTNSFLFLGFWPKSNTKYYLDIVKESVFTVVYFDSPHRVLKSLYKIQEVINKDRRVLVSRELTKMFETSYRGTISEAISRLEEEKNLKGEFVVVVEGS